MAHDTHLMILCIILIFCGVRITTGSSAAFATKATNFVSVLQSSITEGEGLAGSVARVEELAATPSTALTLCKCIISSFEEIQPLVIILASFPLAAVSTPAGILKTAVEQGRLAIESNVKPVLVTMENALVQVVQGSLLGRATIRAMKAFIIELGLDAKFMDAQTLSQSVSQSGNQAAIDNMNSSLATATLSIGDLEPTWTTYNQGLASTHATVNGSIGTATEAVAPVRDMIGKMNSTCTEVRALLSPLSVLNQELRRERCVAVAGLCDASVCGTILDVFTSSNPSEALKKALEPVINTLMGQYDLEAMIGDALKQVFQELESAIGAQSSSAASLAVAFPDVSFPALPPSPVMTVAPAETDPADIASGAVQLVSFQAVTSTLSYDILDVFEQMTAATTTTTTVLVALPKVECEGGLLTSGTSSDTWKHSTLFFVVLDLLFAIRT